MSIAKYVAHHFVMFIIASLLEYYILSLRDCIVVGIFILFGYAIFCTIYNLCVDIHYKSVTVV